MLFKFNNIWKFAFVLIVCWALYGFVGYDFTVITLLAAILGLKLVQETFVI
jgi:hypothetical protein|tara:strand:+ start:234 stop:386 length:153 start_codon:yes stop_codon:yes gene_type:complete